jgi:hypothetical protein
MKKNILLNALAYFPAIVLSLSLAACSRNDGKEQPGETQSADSSSKGAPLQEVSYNLPSPLQIASLFKKSGLKFIEGITNAQNDPARYTSNFSKSLNLGIYGADLAYCVLNKQNQEAMNYMKASTQLSGSLGMTSIFEEGAFVSRFEKYLNNEDSLRNIIAELQMATDTYLEDNEQQQISAIAFSGAWMEAMYIGSKVFEKSKDKGLNDKISEQMTILSRIINVFKTNESKDPGIASLVTDLNGLLDIYNGFESVKKSKSEVREDDFGKIVSLNDAETADLIKKITELRSKFVNS